MLRTTATVILMTAMAAAANAADSSRERLVDLLASDAVDRIEFTATTFDAAMNRITLTADRILDQTADLGGTAPERADLCAAVITALDEFTPRIDGYTFTDLSLVVLDDGDAAVLADVVATAARILDGAGRSGTPRAAAEALFRGVVLDIEEGVPPLQQLLVHVETVAGLPVAEQRPFLS